MTHKHDGRTGGRPADPTAPPAPDGTNLRRWRRITLERQLPRPGILGRLGAPAGLMLVCFVLVGGVTAAYFAHPAAARVPMAVRDSQRELVDEVAHRISVGAQRDTDTVAGWAGTYNADPTHDAARLLQAIVAGEPRWRSVVIWEPGSGAVVAAVGEPLAGPVLNEAAAGHGPVGYLGADQRGRLLHQVKLGDGRLLGAAAAMGIRDLRLEPSNGQTVLFALHGTTLIYSQGSPLTAEDPVRAVVTRAVSAHGTHTSLGGDVTRSGHVRVPVVSAAPVDGSPYKVVSIVYAARAGASASTAAALLGLALVVVGLLGFVWTRLAFIRPMRRLLADAKRAACGEVGGDSSAARLSEVARMGTALDTLRLGDAPTSGRGRRLRLGATTVVSLTSVMAVAWSVGVFVVVRDASTIPRQVIADYQNHADDAANALRDVLDTGLGRLAAFAADDTSPATGRGTGGRDLNAFLRTNDRFRDVYLLDATGRVSRLAGAVPMRQGGWAGTAAGLTLDPHRGAVPVVLAHVPVGSAQLVAEFDVDALRGVLHRVNGHVRVVDRQMRSILATGGYLAFETVQDRDMRSAAQAALAGAETPALPTVRRLVAAAPVGGAAVPAGANPADVAAASPADALSWAVVVTRSVADLQLPGTHEVRRAWLLMLLAITVAVLAWVWQYVIFVRPLRALATTAEQVARGGHPAPVTPERFDEVGALAICLEVCRQARQHGDERLAGAVRLRGAGGDYTVVMSKIKA